MKFIKQPKLSMLKPSAIREVNPKKSYNKIDLEALFGSITANGIIEPLLVAKGKGHTYRLISGSKRLFCAKEIGIRRVPCIIYNADEETCRLYHLISGLCRYETHYLEHANLMKEIMEKGNLEAGQLAALMGLKSLTVQNKMRILELPKEIKDRLIDLNLSETCARMISGLSSDKQNLLFETALKENLCEKELQLEISRILTEDRYENIDFSKEEKTEGTAETIKRKSALGNAKFLTNSLLRLVGRAEESGLPATFKTVETEKYTEYKIRINKKFIPSATQLKIV